MDKKQRTRLVQVFFDHFKTKDEDLFWAWETLSDLQRAGEWELLWQLVVEMVEAAPEDELELLAYIAAGPLEELLCVKGDTFQSRVEALARCDAKFRLALTGVWGLEWDQPLLWERLLPMLQSVPEPL